MVRALTADTCKLNLTYMSLTETAIEVTVHGGGLIICQLELCALYTPLFQKHIFYVTLGN